MRSGVRIPHGAPEYEGSPPRGAFLFVNVTGIRTRKGCASPLACAGVRSAATNPMSLAGGKAANPSRHTRIFAGRTPSWIWPVFVFDLPFDNVCCVHHQPFRGTSPYSGARLLRLRPVCHHDTYATISVDYARCIWGVDVRMRTLFLWIGAQKWQTRSRP